MKTSEAIKKVIKAFEDGNLPKAIVYSIFPKQDCPSMNWSISNRIIMNLVGETSDARTFNQWRKVGRRVCKGKSSFSIFAPKMKCIKVENNDTGEDDILSIVNGFRALPVFRFEDTVGKDIVSKDLVLPRLPLQNVCEYLGIKITAISGNGRYLGYYNDSENSIYLATKQEVILFHELAHKVDYMLRDLKSKEGQQIDREVIAEMSACVIAFLLNKKLPNTIQNHFTYLERYAKKDGKSVIQIVNQYFKEIEAVVSEIVRIAEMVGETNL